MSTVISDRHVGFATKEHAVTALRFAFALVPLLFLADRIEFRAIPAAISVVGIRGALLAMFLQSLGVVVGALRWRVLLQSFGATGSRLPSRSTLVRHCFVGLYFSLIPSGMVGEFVRARRTRDALPVPGDTYVVMFVDRMCASVGLLVVSFVALTDPAFRLANPPLVTSIRVFVGIGLTISILALALPYVVGRYPRIRTAIGRIPRIGKGLASLTAPSDMTGVALALLFSIAVEGSFVAAILATVLPFAPSVSFAAIVMRGPMLLLFTFMPLTPGALGQRELAFVTLLEPLGVSVTDATAAAFVTLAISIVLAGVGGLVMLGDRASRRRNPATSETN